MSICLNYSLVEIIIIIIIIIIQLYILFNNMN